MNNEEKAMQGLSENMTWIYGLWHGTCSTNGITTTDYLLKH